MRKRIIPILVALVLVAGSITTTFYIQQNRYESAIAEANAGTEVLLAELSAYEKENRLRREILTDMLLRLDYKDKPVYVIGHKIPDCDTTCSTIGMAYLLHSLGILAEARVTDTPDLESQFVLSELNYSVPEVLDDATGKQL